MNIKLITKCGKIIIKRGLKSMDEEYKIRYRDALTGAVISSVVDRYDPDCEFYEVVRVEFLLGTETKMRGLYYDL